MVRPWKEGENGVERWGKWEISPTLIQFFFCIFVPFPIRCTHLLQRCVIVVLLVVPFFYFPFFRVVFGTPWCCSTVGRAMEVPLLKAHNGSIFVKKIHCNHLKFEMGVCLSIWGRKCKEQGV